MISRMVTLAGLVATYLLAAPVALAQESLPNFPLLQIEGLRFDTPLPLTVANKTDDLNFLSSLQFGSYSPVVVSAVQTSPSMSDILLPPSLISVSEATNSAVLGIATDSEATDSAELDTTVVVEATDAAAISVKAKKKVTSSITKTASTKLVTTGTVTTAVSPTPSPDPTAKPTEKPSEPPTETAKPVSLSNGGLNADVLFDMSNKYRADQGLAAFTKDDRACALAASRAPEIGEEIANGHMHSGLRARNLPYWNSENIISMRSEAAAFNWWINDKIHHDQIVGDYKYSCVACDGNNCAQEFTNFVNKR